MGEQPGLFDALGARAEAASSGGAATTDIPRTGAVRLVIGRAGTGKSTLLRRRAIDLVRAEPLGPPVLFLVRGEATLDHERHFALASDLDGFARLRVLDFETLGEEVLAECGGKSLRRIDQNGRQMLLGHLLRTHAERLSHFGATARQATLARELDRTLIELTRARADADELAVALAELDAADPTLAALQAKTRDLATLAAAYREALGEDRIDTARRLDLVFEQVPGCRSLAGAHLFVDGFDQFTAFERALIARLARHCAVTTVALTLDPDLRVVDHPDRLVAPAELFAETATTWRLLHAALRQEEVPVERVERLSEAHRFASPALRMLERDLSSPRPSRSEGIDASPVRLIELPDARAEADAAARQVLDWLRDPALKLRMRQIAVVCRDLTPYQPLLEASFGEHGLPFFVDRRRPAQHHPLIKLVRALLEVCRRNWPHEAMMVICKCGLGGMTLGRADALENFILEHRLRGRDAWTDPQPWQGNIADFEDDERAAQRLAEQADRAERLRRAVAEAIAPFDDRMRQPKLTVAERAGALWECLERLRVRRRLERWIEQSEAAGDFESAAEHRQVWKELVSLLEQLVDLMGDEPIDRADYIATLEQGLDQLDLAIAPPTTDQVIIGQVDRTRLIDCRAAVVLGCNDGTFPRAQTEPTVFGDEDRRIMRGRALDVEPDGRTLQLHERYLGYRAMTMPGERLTLTRPLSAGEGQTAAASPFWRHVATLLDITPDAPAADDPVAMSTPRQVVSGVLRWARLPGDQRADQPAAALYPLLADWKSDGEVARLRDLAWPALAGNPPVRLSPEVTRLLWQDELHTSVGRLEAFAACPFKHFAGSTLALRDRPEQDVTPLDMGSVYHGVLERLIRDLLRRKLQFVDPTLPVEELVARLSREVGEQVRGRILLSSARNRYLLRRVEEIVRGVVARQQAALRVGTFRPLAAEVTFGFDRAGEGDDPTSITLPPLTIRTPRGRTVNLHGRIDRLDATPDGLAMVIDYKLSTDRLSLPDAYQGLALQLLGYLLLIRQHGTNPKLKGLRPGAAFYVRLLHGLRSTTSLDAAEEPGTDPFDLRHPPRGIISFDALPRLDETFLHGGTGKSAAYAAQVTQSGAPHANCDVLDDRLFEKLLDRVSDILGELGDRLIDGTIVPRPYRLNKRSACSFCPFARVCRFDPTVDGYEWLQVTRRRQVLDLLGAQPGAVAGPAPAATPAATPASDREATP